MRFPRHRTQFPKPDPAEQQATWGNAFHVPLGASLQAGEEEAMAATTPFTIGHD